MKVLGPVDRTSESITVAPVTRDRALLSSVDLLRITVEPTPATTGRNA